ncbi:GlcG/HbpS family heme-binding protein [Pseudomonas aeruginosa]|uniref:GlcG/HbpS family heme-binding protein n=1 Tax=Pseudomonas aeruginosa TaxID=287 RepID=UPI0011B5FA30|nr:heme-binding protein [Pseudomonas aeruginosa]EKV6491990.1 heme-binding protein [Pseudomonas aeruginosa]TWW48443.1 heme-binding protein [Pseudomonas aeruginosa]TWY05415.1 heme-binding protein [Pseudomonas aeruginosa]HEJ9838660.1 heme-binding protein [Pseudomonas aeruginosa]
MELKKVVAAALWVFSGVSLTCVAESHLVVTEKLDWRAAQKLAAEAVRVCTAEGYAVAVSVVDPSGHQQVVIRGDRAPLQTLSVSYRKAYTAFSYGMTFDKNTTSELIAAKVTGPSDGSLATIPQVLFVPGGVTLRKSDGTVIGGIGVSGAPGGEKDEYCALEAVKKYSGEFN